MRAAAIGVRVLLLQHGAVVHKSIVPLPRLRSVQRLLDQGKELLVPYVFPLVKELMDVDAPDVRVHENDRFVEREGRDRAGCVLPDPRQLDQRFGVSRQPAAVLIHDLLRKRFQRKRPAIVSHAGPDPQKSGERRFCEG